MTARDDWPSRLPEAGVTAAAEAAGQPHPPGRVPRLDALKLRITNAAGVIIADVPLDGDPAIPPWQIEIYADSAPGMTQRYAIISLTDERAEET